MKIEFNSLMDSEEIEFVFLPTIILDKTIYDCSICIAFLCFCLTIEL